MPGTQVCASPGPAPSGRPRVEGKFIFDHKAKLYVRGVAYGPFRPEADGSEYHDPAKVERDFAMMGSHGINALRTYTVPPKWLLDLAHSAGLKVMIGLPWEQHVAFLESSRIAKGIEKRVREGVAACSGHPAVLAYAVGNEIPSPVARWLGRRNVERFLERLYLASKQEDPLGLVTYANYPSTEYLDLPFLDFVSFNVYLETQFKLESYLARLQNIAGDRPLVVTELGLDSLANGPEAQARAMEWQVRTTFAAGCAGAMIFSWTDEWFRGGEDVQGWAFGLTTHDRKPKPALAAVQAAFSDVPFATTIDWPKVSVVICTYNGSKTLRETLEAVKRLDYPGFETIVVNDGSRDASAQIAGEYPVRLITTENRGLSAARNSGLAAATGEIVAYLDDDAHPDPQWLKYLAATLKNSDHVGVGGPNIAPPGDGFRADCIAHAPGGPIHVLLTDTVAEHLPGCNMAFRREALRSIGGFDEQFRIAGDDVDVCWRLQEKGWTLGFSPSAVVWHHRRGKFLAYWKQQLNYGRAEAMLERKWPHKYNALGNPTWSGRLYGRGLLQAIGFSSARIYHGTWGGALFQSVYHTVPSPLHALPTTPEWYLIVLLLGAMACWGTVWSPLLAVLPLFIVCAGITLIQAMGASRRAIPRAKESRATRLWMMRLATTWLHVLQPVARLIGRLHTGLTPWRRRGPGGWRLPLPRTCRLWSEDPWQSLEHQLSQLESHLRDNDLVVLRGGNFDDWDLEIRGGLIGFVRLRMTVEEHGSGKQLFLLRCWPRCTRGIGLITLLFILINDAAALSEAWETWVISAIAMLCMVAILLREIGGAMAAVMHVTRNWKYGGKR